MEKPIKKADLDFSTAPQDDFYQFVNGGWLAKHTIPPSENRWGAFHVLHDANRSSLRTLLEGLKRRRLKKGSDLAKLRDLYTTSMDMKARNRQGTHYLGKGLATAASFNAENVDEVFSFLGRQGVDAPWRLWIDQDDKNSKRMVLRIGQGGIGVPNKNYHTKDDPESRRIRNAYKKHIERILTLEGFYKRKEIRSAVATIFRVETVLARASMSPVEQRNVHAMYNKYTEKELLKEFPSVPWRSYFDLLGIPKPARRHIIVDHPKFVKTVERLLRSLPAEDWCVYLRWHFLDAYAGVLGENFINERFHYHGRELQGTTEVPELWKRSVSVVSGMMPDAVGKLYVQKYFPPHAKRTIRLLVQNLINAYRKRLSELDWMTPKTRKRALKKLDTMNIQLGYPKKWQSYRKLKVDTESFAKNILDAVAFDFDRAAEKLAKPTDPNEWNMSAATVNAFYSPNLNQILFPAGILQPPFFYHNADEAVNYGAIGAVIGHELTHALDDQGSLFDEHGNLKNWWTKRDREQFERRAKVLERQFNRYKVVGNLTVNGKLTLGENIADLGGLVIAYEAFKMATADKPQRKIDGFTPDQRFFISHATVERCLTRDEFLKFMVLNDPHSPSEFRSNGPVSNCEGFYRTFDVKPGDGLYRPPSQRAVIW